MHMQTCISTHAHTHIHDWYGVCMVYAHGARSEWVGEWVGLAALGGKYTVIIWCSQLVPASLPSAHVPSLLAGSPAHVPARPHTLPPSSSRPPTCASQVHVCGGCTCAHMHACMNNLMHALCECMCICVCLCVFLYVHVFCTCCFVCACVWRAYSHVSVCVCVCLCLNVSLWYISTSNMHACY